MASKTNISVIKFDEEAEYTGELTIDLAGENARCMYDLTNFVDSTKNSKESLIATILVWHQLLKELRN